MTNPKARKFSAAWTYRTPLLTIDYSRNDETINADVIAAADAAGVLQPIEEKADASDGLTKGVPARRTLNLKG